MASEIRAGRRIVLVLVSLLLLTSCGGGSGGSGPAPATGGTPPPSQPAAGGTPDAGAGDGDTTPADDATPAAATAVVALTRSLGKQLGNREAVIPPQCYTATDNIANPCYTCHVASRQGGRNFADDWSFQREYAFSDVGLTNQWDNLFVDRSEAMARISDEEVLAYIREDNYTPLVAALAELDDFAGWAPDLDFTQGFDDEGFAADGSGWRAIRYKPFLGTFFPTNGNTDDVFIRLPEAFRTDAEGRFSREIYKLNLAVLEASVSVAPELTGAEQTRRVEPVDESLAGIDLDGDGTVNGLVDRIVGLPEHYFGAAAAVPVDRLLYPFGVEFLHTVRYVDPEAPGMLATRMKEVRYSTRTAPPDLHRLQSAYERELNAKEMGQLPSFAGSGETGLRNGYDWHLYAFIEDADGALRSQTYEETWFCMGCHSNIGVTVDQTFALSRKVPGAEGWHHQNPEGIQDVPQYYQQIPEYLDYFANVKGADEFRANTEIHERFFVDATVPEAELEVDRDEVLRAAPGGDEDIAHLILPSHARALDLDRAYMALVRAQAEDPLVLTRGRDTILAPLVNVHRTIDDDTPDLQGPGGATLIDPSGGLWLDWDWTPAGP